MKIFDNMVDFLKFCHSAFDHIPIAIDFLDQDGTMIYINQAFSDFLQIPIEDMLGENVSQINPTSKFLETLQLNRPDIAVRHSFPNGKDAICHRIPILNDEGSVVGGMGMILFEEYQQMQALSKKCASLDLEVQRYRQEAAKSNQAKYSLEQIIGVSCSMQDCKYKTKKLATVNMDVMILGESGVGKELFAHAIHNESARAAMPFVTINCSAIPENLLESELFGYVEGSFTGAKRGGKVGKFELANGGTLFLDEIGDMPYYMQAKILRVLQEKEVTPVGGNQAKPLDVRVVSATHRNLNKMIHEGTFREDLYYRLNVLSLNIPPLRERIEDISLLTDHFLSEYRKQSGVVHSVSEEALQILEAYAWPGNIRQLRNAVDFSCVNSDRPEISTSDLPQFLFQNEPADKRGRKLENLPTVIENTEQRAIQMALEKCRWNKTEAAKMLGIPRVTLYRKLKKFNI